MPEFILDTDIGTDVDDALALALCLALADIHLVAVTTVYVNAPLRAKIAAKLLRLAGRDDIPVYIGTDTPLEAGKELFWGGHEGRGLLTQEEVETDAARFAIRGDAVSFLRQAMNSARQTCVAGIGPYTNLAIAFRELAAGPLEVLLMGGIYDHTRYGDSVDHNILADVTAAHAAFDSPYTLRVTTLDTTMQTRFDRKDVEDIRRCNAPFTDALSTLMRIWLDKIDKPYGHLHDPLAIAPIVGADFTDYKPARIALNERGFTEIELCASEQTRTFVSVSVRAEEFNRWFFDTICSFEWPR
jgi:purine nucleosidase